MRSFRAAEAIILAALLTGCAATGRIAQAPATDPRLPPSLCVAPQPGPSRPPDAGLVRPASPREAEATAALLGWVAAILDHDADLARRLTEIARSRACGGRGPPV